MNDAEVREYLLSHAPLDRFYLYAPGGHDDGLIRFTDPAGRAFVLAEDDDDLARHAIAVLKALGVRVFEDFSELLQYENRTVP